MDRTAAAILPFSVRLGGPHPLRFGHGRRWLVGMAEKLPAGWSEEARLFAGTYIAGFFAVSLFIA